MSKSTVLSTCAPPPSIAWQRLVARSFDAWETLSYPEDRRGMHHTKEHLEHITSLDEFLGRSPDHCMFWFFQRRESFLLQPKMSKWNRDRLEDYVLLPAVEYYINRDDCYFVSHYWRTGDDPDPDGGYLRLLQSDLRHQDWQYIWVDWTCMPQYPRSEAEGNYFIRALAMMSSLIRNCGFAYHYPPFEARLWILYEVAEFSLTSSGAFAFTSDIEEFIGHVHLMSHLGVQHVLDAFEYRCSNERDRAFLTSWLELLILLKQLKINLGDRRRLLDTLTWFPTAETSSQYNLHGLVEVHRFQGTLTLNGEVHTFKPFPALDYNTFFDSVCLEDKRTNDSTDNNSGATVPSRDTTQNEL